MRLIDVDDYCQNICRCNKDMCERDKCTIRTAKTVDAVPVVHDKWIGFTHSAFHGLDDYGEPIYRDCVTYTHRKCGFNSVIRHKYCPHCGAKMYL